MKQESANDNRGRDPYIKSLLLMFVSTSLQSCDRERMKRKQQHSAEGTSVDPDDQSPDDMETTSSNPDGDTQESDSDRQTLSAECPKCRSIIQVPVDAGVEVTDNYQPTSSNQNRTCEELLNIW
ncbi:uncharacterized protein AKAME5_002591000 [Lates japonicus]|uniref:Uncharacterized protein n=1 Tax=Lates japonicus TaxID=270547 RepID=A0AAD3RL87_LATJO|nr:uncharacterized protein AKAME5_002591000 [Lates japonicus]